MKLIVGLGNPGQGFSDNRHNIGFICVNYFAKKHDIHFDKKKGNARIGKGEIEDITVVVAKPQTFMNNSGKAVNTLLRKLNISSDDLIVVHDDLDLPLGKIRIRKGGSSGGHNGVQSIIGDIGTAEFIRIKVGIGRPSEKSNLENGNQDVINYVLSGFSYNERSIMDQIIPFVNESIECLITLGSEIAMNRFNSTRVVS